jgi:hypothetical protein
MSPKQCTLCSTPRPVLVRCQIDDTATWHFVCPGACWKKVSGGVEDAKGLEGEYPWYKYGGMVRFQDSTWHYALKSLPRLMIDGVCVVEG